jgi:hypothetical protein
MSNARKGYVLAAGALLLGLLWLGTPGATAKPSICSNRSVSGDYGFIVNGTNVGAGLVASVGQVTADGRGNLVGSDTTSVNGVLLRRTVTGTYTVAPDCSGQLSFTDNFGLTTNLDFVIVDQLEQVNFIQTDASTVTTGVARKE